MLITLLSFAFALSATTAAVAQADAPEPYVLKLEARPDFKSGKVATVKGFADDKGPLMTIDSLSIFQPVSVTVIADDKGPLMTIDSLSIFQPVSVTVIADDKADDLHVKIGKAGLKDMIFDGTTKGTGVLTAKFRSEDEAQLLITSATGRKRFNLIVWVGPILKPRGQSLLRPIMEGN